MKSMQGKKKHLPSLEAGLMSAPKALYFWCNIWHLHFLIKELLMRQVRSAFKAALIAAYFIAKAANRGLCHSVLYRGLESAGSKVVKLTWRWLSAEPAVELVTESSCCESRRCLEEIYRQRDAETFLTLLYIIYLHAHTDAHQKTKKKQLHNRHT